ncbi:MAG TPA: glycosyltransferase, partial [Nannocystaceae bacterium]|nr:glycosyltransferase [Nannocystaceae bacterium]
VGEHSGRALVERFRSHPRRPLPRVRLACEAGLARGLEDVERERTAHGHAALAKVRARDDLRLPARVLAKLRDDRPLRVWIWTSIHTTVLQHVARGLAQGFRELGHTAELLVESDPREQLEAPEVASSLAAFDPDLAVFIDHARPEYGPLLPRTLPIAAWILDELPLLADPRVVGQLCAFDLAFAWSRPLTEDYLRRGYPHCEQLPFAVDLATYGVAADAPADDTVAYATHLSFPFEPSWAPGLYRELERRMMAMTEVPSGIEPLAPLLEETVRALGIRVPADERRDLAYQCLMIARHVDRVRIADQMLAAGVPVALYGRGWGEIERFAPHARGLVEPGPALRRMYQRHKVVLHINTRCNLHPRVLEAAAAGGFVLARSDGESDFAPGSVGDYLAVDRELCRFDGKDDMIAKIRRAFADESWRQGFVQSARARVHRDHTYAQRAQQMVDALGRRLAVVLGKADAA